MIKSKYALNMVVIVMLGIPITQKLIPEPSTPYHSRSISNPLATKAAYSFIPNQGNIRERNNLIHWE